MYTVKRYSYDLKDTWNKFLKTAKNSVFLFDRNYMDYHSDRFEDHSLMFYDNKNTLKAILPANLNDHTLYSHQGLTYGGFITAPGTNTLDFLELFSSLISYLKSEGIIKLIYKKIPYIYTEQPNAEDEYALFRYNAKLTVCNVSSTLDLTQKYTLHRSRKGAINKASKYHFLLIQNKNWPEFWSILSENLSSRYKSKPVHNLEEIQKLNAMFPDNIHLFTAVLENKVEAGVVIYETDNMAHCQYISSSQSGKNHCALDFIFDKLLNEVFINKRYFDFGSSTEQGGKILNESLLFQKEGFGASAVNYNHYELEIS